MFQAVRDASERRGVGDLLAEGHALVQALTNGHLGPGAEEMDDGIVQGGSLRVVCHVTTADAGEPGEGIVDGARAEGRPHRGDALVPAGSSLPCRRSAGGVGRVPNASLAGFN